MASLWLAWIPPCFKGILPIWNSPGGQKKGMKFSLVFGALELGFSRTYSSLLQCSLWIPYWLVIGPRADNVHTGHGVKSSSSQLTVRVADAQLQDS